MQKMFEPLKLGSVTLANRIIMGSMHTGLEDRLSDLIQLTDYFLERARGTGPALIITGGYSPNYLGRLTPFAGSFNSERISRAHKKMTDIIHSSGESKMILQLLHAGRYSFHPFSVAPSRIQSPITPFKPWALPGWAIDSTIHDFQKAAQLAQKAGYAGVEIMGSEGYFLHQFFASRTNKRQDNWGGSLENRMRLGSEIVRRIRQTCGEQFLILFRIPILDLLSDGSPWSEIEAYAMALEKAGVHILNSGIGWHESRVPTIATMVPRKAFAEFTEKLKKIVTVPVVATNRFSEPQDIEDVLQKNQADLISMARPFLADPQFVQKARDHKISQINPCIACNQACLDHIFSNKKASCLVNPTACEESYWKNKFALTSAKKKVAVVGSGVAGLNASLGLLKSGHQVEIFEASNKLGGQFNLAAAIPGKKDYATSISHWESELNRLGARVHFNHKIHSAEELQNFDHIVLAAGILPRKVSIPGQDLPHVVSYESFLKGQHPLGQNIVIIGAGGIGIDSATYALHKGQILEDNITDFFKHWGIDSESTGGLKTGKIPVEKVRQITLLQRSRGPLGRTLGKTTSWIHRLDLKRHGVKFLNGLQYDKITPTHVEITKLKGEKIDIPCDQVVICAGQIENNSLENSLKEKSLSYTVIGGARQAGELDAKRAIRDAFEFVANFNEIR
jgi:2,4-dienoyl-CoA reductase (NADPH2)